MIVSLLGKREGEGKGAMAPKLGNLYSPLSDDLENQRDSDHAECEDVVIQLEVIFRR